MQRYACKEIRSISRYCLNRDAIGGPSSKRIIFVNDKGKGRMNLVDIQDETREEAIANFEQSLYNEVDVMATKQMQVEVRTQSGKQIKEMARDKGAKKCRRRRLGLHDFLI